MHRWLVPKLMLAAVAGRAAVPVLRPPPAREPTWTPRALPDQPWKTSGNASGSQHAARASPAVRPDDPGGHALPDAAKPRADMPSRPAADGENPGWLRRPPMAVPEATAAAPERETESGRVVRPVFGPVARDGDAPALEFTVPAGDIYLLEALSGLGGTNWITVTNVAAKLADVPVRVRGPLDRPQRFYRPADVADID